MKELKELLAARQAKQTQLSAEAMKHAEKMEEAKLKEKKTRETDRSGCEEGGVNEKRIRTEGSEGKNGCRETER